MTYTLAQAEPADRADIWRSIGVEVGVAAALVSVIFFLERSFLGRVTRAVEPLRREIAELRSELRSPQQQVSEGLQEQHEKRAGIVNDLIAANYKDVKAALEEAASLNLFGSSKVSVEADPQDWGCRVIFDYPTLVAPGGVRQQALYVGAGDSGTYVEWKEDQELKTIGVGVDRMLHRHGVSEHERMRLDWDTVFTNLSTTLAVALNPGSWGLSGEVLTLVGDWAITTAGLEHRTKGTVVPNSLFPPRNHIDESIHRFSSVPNPGQGDWVSPCPDWVAAREWQYVLRLAKSILPVEKPSASVGKARRAASGL